MALEELENQLPAKTAFDERASRSEDYCRVLQTQLAEAEAELERRRLRADEIESADSDEQLEALHAEVEHTERELAAVRNRRKLADAARGHVTEGDVEAEGAEGGAEAEEEAAQLRKRISEI